MPIYEFTAYGKTLTTETDTVKEAMEAANKLLVWPEEGPAGAWMSIHVLDKETQFRWVEGDFFD